MFDWLLKKSESKAKYMHVALDIEGIDDWVERKKLNLVEGYQYSLAKLRELMELQVEHKIPVMSFLILPLSQERRSELLKEFSELICKEDFWDYLRKNKIKVTIFGKWYNLPSEVIGKLKCLIEGTKDYDHFFLNFCLNYDGQEEILGALKLIIRQIEKGKLSLENISKETIKENLYTSYFMPPDLMIKNGNMRNNGFLLWDGVRAKVVFTEKEFPELSKSDFEKVLRK